MRILFLCRDNGARSQMAEALAKSILGPEAEVASAGITAGTIHPLATEAMLEVGLNIANQSPKPLTAAMLRQADLVVFVCERELSEACLPRQLKRQLWPLMDPLDPPAAPAELKLRFRDTRMALSKHIKSLTKLKPSQLRKSG